MLSDEVFCMPFSCEGVFCKRQLYRNSHCVCFPFNSSSSCKQCGYLSKHFKETLDNCVFMNLLGKKKSSKITI